MSLHSFWHWNIIEQTIKFHSDEKLQKTHLCTLWSQDLQQLQLPWLNDTQFDNKILLASTWLASLDHTFARIAHRSNSMHLLNRPLCNGMEMEFSVSICIYIRCIKIRITTHREYLCNSVFRHYSAVQLARVHRSITFLDDFLNLWFPRRKQSAPFPLSISLIAHGMAGLWVLLRNCSHCCN